MTEQRRIIVFSGPSLTDADRARYPDVDWRPPAMTGDMLRLANEPSSTICLIDGYFDHCPAPWHKEILALLQAGFAVLGAASMGALRAAELDRLGMIGIGAIYSAYRDGVLTGDDEVALVHATDSLRWAALTVPMVDVRATLLAAVRKRTISPAQARALRLCWHQIHYADRDWPLMIKAALAERLVDPVVLKAVQDGQVSLKRQDAVRCITVAQTIVSTDRKPSVFPQTCFFKALQEWVRT